MQPLKVKVFQCALSLILASAAWGATFGKVVPVGGHTSDIALDERRKLVYAANFTANRIEVLSMTDETLRAPIPVAPQPYSLALQPGEQRLVVAHYDGSLTILDLDAGTRQHLTVGPRVLGAAFGAGSLALVVAEDGWRLLDPSTGTLQVIVPAELTSKGLPVPWATFPPEIVGASMNVSRDGRYVVGIAEVKGGTNATADFRYDVFTQQLTIITITAQPPLGPRTVSVNADGSRFVAGWAMFDINGVLWAEFPAPTGALSTGGHAWDTSRHLIYAQIPEGQGFSSAPGQTATPGSPGTAVLHILDEDNLTVRDRLRLPENLGGKALIRGDFHRMYAVSDSGVMILPIGSLAQTPRVMSQQEDVIFRGNFCDRRVFSRQITIVDPGGGATDFSLSTSTNGITISPTSGTTPAQVTITLDPNVYQNQNGTTTGQIQIASSAGVNLPLPVRILVNTRQPEQRGVLYDVPGKLVDVLADPVRNRFYVIRQDQNLVLVFDGTGFNQLAALRTGNTPTQMAMTTDSNYLIVGNDNSQIASVFDLNTLQQSQPIIFPFGHYPRTIAVSNVGMFASVRGVSVLEQCTAQNIQAGPSTIDRIDFATRTATTSCSLGVYNNIVNQDMALTSSPSGWFIFGAMPDGTVLLYDASADTFVASRKDFTALRGAYAAVNDRTFVVDNNVLDWSLVPLGTLGTGNGLSSGFSFVDGYGLRTNSPSITGPGVIERVDLAQMTSIGPTKVVESPLEAESLVTPTIGQIGETILPFTRTLAPLVNRTSIVSLTVSGFTALPWAFDAALAKPNIQSVVNLADGSSNVAPGSLISVFGTNLSAVTAVNTEIPVPTILGESCMTVNGVLTPLVLASPGQINGQLPFEVSGSATMVLKTPGGTSNSFGFTVLPSAPAIFQTGTAGPQTGLPAIYRAVNNELLTLSNPVHPEDVLVIYLTGLGTTAPSVATGAAAPLDPLAMAQLIPPLSIGGVPLQVLYAGLVPGQVGVYQINAFVPKTVPAGLQLPFTIGLSGQGQITLNVRVVH